MPLVSSDYVVVTELKICFSESEKSFQTPKCHLSGLNTVLRVFQRNLQKLFIHLNDKINSLLPIDLLIQAEMATIFVRRCLYLCSTYFHAFCTYQEGKYVTLAAILLWIRKYSQNSRYRIKVFS